VPAKERGAGARIRPRQGGCVLSTDWLARAGIAHGSEWGGAGRRGQCVCQGQGLEVVKH